MFFTRRKTRLMFFVVGMLLLPVANAAFFEGKKLVVQDLPFGEVLYDFYLGNYFDSTVKLMAAKELGRVTHHKDETDLLLGGLYLSYGLHLEAEKIFKRLIAEGASPEIHDKAWYNLAKVRYQKGLYEDAIRAIEEIGQALPQNLKDDTDMMMANLLMARGQYDEASTLLQRMLDNKDISTYARFNLGISMYRNNKQIEGAEYLDMVGRLERGSDEEKALRDKANVALGYSLLAGEEPEKAKAYFQRVLLDSPFVNKALLGLGWSNAMMKQYEKALSPWMALAKKERNDSSVYESLIAVAYGLEQLEAYPQSMQSYQLAISVFQGEMDSIDTAISAVRDGDLLDKLFVMFSQLDDPDNWEIEDLPKVLEARYLTNILASHEFHDAIKNMREVKELRENLKKWDRDLPTFSDMLQLRKETYEKRLPELIAEKGALRLAALRDERNLYQEEMDRIVREGDILALATDKERAQVDRLNKVKDTLRLVSTRMDPAQYQTYVDKYRLYRGLLEWDIGTTVKSRQWKIQKSLRDLDRELSKTEFQQKLLQRAKAVAPKGFEGYSKQIAFYSKKVNQLQKNLEDVYVSQKQDVEALIVAELTFLKQHLVEYLDQARFAMARLQDAASRKGGGQ